MKHNLNVSKRGGKKSNEKKGNGKKDTGKKSTQKKEDISYVTLVGAFKAKRARILYVLVEYVVLLN